MEFHPVRVLNTDGDYPLKSNRIVLVNNGMNTVANKAIFIYPLLYIFAVTPYTIPMRMVNPHH